MYVPTNQLMIKMLSIYLCHMWCKLFLPKILLINCQVLLSYKYHNIINVPDSNLFLSFYCTNNLLSLYYQLTIHWLKLDGSVTINECLLICLPREQLANIAVREAGPLSAMFAGLLLCLHRGHLANIVVQGGWPSLHNVCKPPTFSTQWAACKHCSWGGWPSLHNICKLPLA